MKKEIKIEIENLEEAVKKIKEIEDADEAKKDGFSLNIKKNIHDLYGKIYYEQFVALYDLCAFIIGWVNNWKVDNKPFRERHSMKELTVLLETYEKVK